MHTAVYICIHESAQATLWLGASTIKARILRQCDDGDNKSPSHSLCLSLSLSSTRMGCVNKVRLDTPIAYTYIVKLPQRRRSCNEISIDPRRRGRERVFFRISVTPGMKFSGRRGRVTYTRRAREKEKQGSENIYIVNVVIAERTR